LDPKKGATQVLKELNANLKDAKTEPDVLIEIKLVVAKMNDAMKELKKKQSERKWANINNFKKVGGPTLKLFVVKSAAAMGDKLRELLAKVVGKSGAPTPDEQKAGKEGGGASEEGTKKLFIETGEGTRSLGGAGVGGDKCDTKSPTNEVNFKETGVPRWYCNSAEGKDIGKNKVEKVIISPPAGMSATLEQTVTVKWDQGLMDTKSNDLYKQKKCNKATLQLYKQSTLSSMMKRMYDLSGSWAVNMTDPAVCKEDGKNGRECRWDWKVQSSSKLWNGKELFSPLASSKRYFFVVWCDDRIRSATPGDVPEFEILESVHSDGAPLDEGPGPCTKSLMVSISIAPNLIWPLGVDFSLPHCGKALYGKIKGLVNNVFKKKEGQPEVNPDTGELVATSANTTAHLNEAASEVTAAETETEGTDSGITEAGGVAACKKLDIIGSVLIDASMLMPIITVLSRAWGAIKIAEGLALSAKDAHDLYTYSQGGKAPKPDKGAFVKCMTEVLQLPEFLVDNKHMTTATPEIKKMLDKLPDRDPFTDQDFAFIKRMKRITRMLMSLKNPNRWVNETSVSGEEPTEALKLVAKVFKSALDKCSPGWLAAMTRLAETANRARKVLTAILVEDMVAAATALAGGLGLTVAAHFGPIVDAAKCVWGVTKQVCKKALAKIFKSSPCKTVCTPLKKGGAETGPLRTPASSF